MRPRHEDVLLGEPKLGDERRGLVHQTAGRAHQIRGHERDLLRADSKHQSARVQPGDHADRAIIGGPAVGAVAGRRRDVDLGGPGIEPRIRAYRGCEQSERAADRKEQAPRSASHRHRT